ncbi:hypothetical protein KC19_7G074200 [Ceratodon purpureus]|uniref:Uncharacterized protein n=1 Tax=Ceratodon purpureus TaxID=3225 RepID=A0A8T0H8L2_CERPU|nr:hypothetical protein KC19_7G074200 [Ceratodon purpureus]
MAPSGHSDFLSHVSLLPSCASAIFLTAQVPARTQPWPMLTWEQCLLGTNLPPPLQDLSETWSLIRGAVIWIIWICRNACVFHDHRWTDAHMHQTLWDAILDLGRANWAQVTWTFRTHPTGIPRARDKFRAIWEPGGVFCAEAGDSIQWNYRHPAIGLFR